MYEKVMEDSSSPPYRALASLLLYLFRKQAGPKEMAPLPPVYKAASLTTWFFPPKRQTLRSGADRFIESDGLGSVLKEKLRSVMEIHAKPPCENEKERERDVLRGGQPKWFSNMEPFRWQQRPRANAV